MRELLHELNAALAAGRACVHCTVVETRGSTPQKAGAAMLVFADGAQVGTLGGGCVEAEVKRRVLAGGAAAELFVFTLDHDYGWDDGLICGGRMSILAQPLAADDAATRSYFTRYEETLAAGVGCVEALACEAGPGVPLGSRVLFGADRQPLARLGLDAVPPAWPDALPDLARRPKPSFAAGVAFLAHWPRIRLVIVGGGHVGQAVGDFAAQADFDVWAIDDREAYANPARFPRAQRLIVGDVPRTLRDLAAAGTFAANTFAIIVTRGHSNDEAALHELTTAGCCYLGLIGSRRKIRLVFEDLEGKGVPKEALAKVHAPLGVHIGSQTVPEIAISIVAELIARRNLGRVPEELRRRHAPADDA